MSFKDTAFNIRMTEEFTVNIVDDATLAAMNVCAIAFPPEVDELEAAGLTPMPGVHVKSPRIAEAPASLECRRYMTLEVGKSREIILGLVLGCFVREAAVDPANKHVDQRLMDAVGRLGGHGYARIRDQFDLPTPSVEEWDGAPAASAARRRNCIRSGSGQRSAATVGESADARAFRRAASPGHGGQIAGATGPPAATPCKQGMIMT